MAKILFTAKIVVHIGDATVEIIEDTADVQIIAETEEIIIKTIHQGISPTLNQT